MNNIWKRSLSMLLVLVMVVGMLPMNALAAEQETSDDFAEVVETDVPDCAEGHAWGLWEPTEDESAEYRVCTVCGETETYVYEVVETVVAEAQAAAEGEEPEPADLADAEGIIWMDKEKHNNAGQFEYFAGKIAASELDDIIRNAVGVTDASVKVKYDGMDVGDTYSMMLNQNKLTALKDELTDAVTNHQLVTFDVGGTNMDIAFRNVLTVNVEFPAVVIESKGAPADLAAKVAAGVNELKNGVKISHIFEISQEKAGADISERVNDYAWPAAGEEVVAAEVAVTIYDSIDGTAHTQYGEVVLKDTRNVCTVTYLDADGTVLLSESVVENEATPVCNPTRTYYTLSWDKEIAATVTGDVTYNATWTPDLDVNDNDIADQEEYFTVTFADGQGGEVVRSVKWGRATPSYTPSRKYYTFDGWDKAVAATVTNDVTYTATWKAINDDDGDNIANEEEFYTITYVDEDGSQIAEFSVKWGEATEKPADPERPGTGYRFGGWIPAVAAKVTGDAEYTATWTNSSIVTFNMYGFEFTQPVNNEGKVANPAPDTDDDGIVWEGWFYTDDDGVEKAWDFLNDTTDKDITLVARYADDTDNDGLADGTAEDPMITYIFQYMNESAGESYELERISILDGAQPDWLYWDVNPNNGEPCLMADKSAVYVEDTDEDGFVFLGWTAGLLDDGDPANLFYTFGTRIGPDWNNNGVEDGPEDPLHSYEFWYGEFWAASELWMEGMPEINVDDPKYVEALNLPYPKVFVEWDEEVVDNGGLIAHIYTAVVMDDANNNGTDDEEEIDKLEMKLDFSEENVISSFDGSKVITHYGNITVQGANGENLLIEKDGKLTFTMTDETVITVVPEPGFYVVDIELTGPNTAGWKVTWEGGVATLRKAPVYIRAGVATIAEENPYTFNVIFGAADFIETNKTEFVIDIRDAQNFGKKEVYESLVSFPKYDEKAVTVEYLARTAQKATVDLTTSIYKYIEDAAIVEAAKSMLGNSISVDLETKWVDLDDSAATEFKTVDAVVMEYLEDNGFMKENGKIDTDKLIQSAATLEKDLTAVVNNNALVEPFGYIDPASGGGEYGFRNLYVAYESEQLSVEIDDRDTAEETPFFFVKMEETRETPTVTFVKDTVEMSYAKSETIKETLLKNIVVRNNAGEIINNKVTINLTFEENIGNNTVTVEVPQSSEYYAGKFVNGNTFTLKLKPVNATISVGNVIVDMDTSYDIAQITPTVNPNTAELVQVIAGIDMTNLDFALDKADKELDVNDIDVKAWVKIPAGSVYEKIISAVELDTGFHTIDQITDALSTTDLSEVVGEGVDMNELADQLADKIEKVVAQVESQLYNRVDLNYGITVCFEQNAKPENAGVYINYVTLMDKLTSKLMGTTAKYVAEDAKGIIVIHPLTVLPNNGIQLFLGETSNTQNIFEIIIDGENKDLGVLYEGNVVDCNVHYYGFTTRANVYISTEGPQEAGIYIAAAALYDGEEKLGTDMAVMLMAPEISNIEVDSQKVKYDGEAHKLVPTVTDSKGNVLTEGVGITMITGSVDVDAGNANVGLSDISANLNIDFPKDLDDAWDHYVASRYDVPEEITVQTVLNFLDWCNTQIDTKVPVELLTKVVDQSYITKAQNYAKAGINNIKDQLERLPDVNASVTFEDNKQFTEHGIYVYCGVVTDPDLLPDANAGVLVIYTADTFLMTDTVKVYNGQEQMPDLIDETGRDRIDMIVDRAANRVNFKLDGDATKLIEKIEKKFNVTINNNEIALQELYDRSGLKAEDLANTIIDYIWEQVPERLTNRFPGAADKVEEMIEKLEGKLPGVRAKLINKLVEIDKLPDDLTLAFNKPGAIEVGTYEFHSFSYEIGYTTAMLEIIEEEQLGTIGSGKWRMDLDSVVYLDYYPVFNGFAEDFDFATRAGAIIWTSKTAPTHRDQLIWDFENPENNVNLYDAKGMHKDENGWYIESLEIYAKNLGDMVYIRPYVVAADGSYVYYDGAPYYSPARYCYDILCNMGEREDTRAVCAALLEYGASAQDYFDYNEDAFVTDIPAGPNKKEPEKWINIDLSIYDLECKDNYLDEVVVDDHIRALAPTLTGTRKGITACDPTLDLKGAIRLSVAYNLNSSIIDVDNVAKAEVLFWTASEIAQLDTLAYETVGDATYSCTLTKATGDEELYIGDYLAESDYILAKNLSESVYYSCRITMNDGTVYRSGLGYYSPEQFVIDHLAVIDGTLVETVSERIAVYGEMARIRFAK